jgi:hypothetical protein
MCLRPLSHLFTPLLPSTQVPIGPLAFFPGKLVHTNEITVLLGDNYFIKCTAARAAEIATRRIQRKFLQHSLCGDHEPWCSVSLFVVALFVSLRPFAMALDLITKGEGRPLGPCAASLPASLPLVKLYLRGSIPLPHAPRVFWLTPTATNLTELDEEIEASKQFQEGLGLRQRLARDIETTSAAPSAAESTLATGGQPPSVGELEFFEPFDGTDDRGKVVCLCRVTNLLHASNARRHPLAPSLPGS